LDTQRRRGSGWQLSDFVVQRWLPPANTFWSNCCQTVPRRSVGPNGLCLLRTRRWHHYSDHRPDMHAAYDREWPLVGRPGWRLCDRLDHHPDMRPRLHCPEHIRAGANLDVRYDHRWAVGRCGGRVCSVHLARTLSAGNRWFVHAAHRYVRHLVTGGPRRFYGGVHNSTDVQSWLSSDGILRRSSDARLFNKQSVERRAGTLPADWWWHNDPDRPNMHVARGVQRRVVSIPHRDVHSGVNNNFVLQPWLST
jgi:hypothetical protein